jgi:hypothetical protein
VPELTHVGTGDYSGTGQNDIVFQNTNGVVVVCTKVIASSSLGTRAGLVTGRLQD